MQGQSEHYSTSDLLDKLNSALSLSKVLPPSKLKKNLIGFINLAPQIEDNLMQKIQLPMEIDNSDPQRPFLKTQFNRQCDSYRSPYTNQYVPSAQGYRTSGVFRAMQETGAVLFAEYVKLYYGGNTVGNFYVLQNQDDNRNLSCGFFAKKQCTEEDGFKGTWDSFNIVDVTFEGANFSYSLNSTILIQMDIEKQGTNVSGFLKKQKIEKAPVSHQLNQQDTLFAHLVVIGQMIEQIQTTMRQHLEAIYVSRTQQIIFTTRYQNTIEMQKHKKGLADQLRKLKFGN